MVRSFGILCVFTVGLMAGASSALALGPVNPLPSSSETQHVSFFGRPYPFGYTGWGRCVRYVEVETRSGPRLRRVRACR
ncbi:hypothetical protein [Bradyrhizobium sp. dw_78]|uniref:hypothetical protein n=1 Tax=Bradyrhizobium sp. dw_78 TaxID=2719793 RepID=UPI001BD233CE|nr:hypothetical protein [Bradyrhizobium sp. dw_78]